LGLQRVPHVQVELNDELRRKKGEKNEKKEYTYTTDYHTKRETHRHLEAGVQ
jgi:hypothetical protein